MWIISNRSLLTALHARGLVTDLKSVSSVTSTIFGSDGSPAFLNLKELWLRWIHCHFLYLGKTKEVITEQFWILLEKIAVLSEYAT